MVQPWLLNSTFFKKKVIIKMKNIQGWVYWMVECLSTVDETLSSGSSFANKQRDKLSDIGHHTGTMKVLVSGSYLRIFYLLKQCLADLALPESFCRSRVPACGSLFLSKAHIHESHRSPEPQCPLGCGNSIRRAFMDTRKGHSGPKLDSEMWVEATESHLLI